MKNVDFRLKTSIFTLKMPVLRDFEIFLFGFEIFFRMKLFAFLAVTVFADYDGHVNAIDQATLLTSQNQANVDNAGAAHAAGSCFTCSAFGANTADTYANCHSSGSVMACPTENSLEEGEKLCSLDVTRAANGEVIGITTGCKDRVVSF